MTRSPEPRRLRDWPPPDDGPRRRLGNTAAAAVVTVGSALVVATCSTAHDRAPPPATPAPLDALVSAAAASAESAAPPIPTAMPAPPPAEPAPAPAAAGPLPRTVGHELDNFYAALRALEKHARREHVRVAWLGDSHGASDLWSGPLRDALQARFGDGGPGFVHVGYKAYRHDGVRIEIRGRWVPSPRGPSTPVRTGDGVFGLGGVVLSGSAEGPHAAITVTDPALPPALTWDLCYKLGSAQDQFHLALSGEPERDVKAAAGEALGPLRHLVMQSTVAAPSLKAMPLGGQPGFCGVTIETDPSAHPGVVLDTLGINGARLTTPLAWDERAWIDELRRRPPGLVVVEYGTNESGDPFVRPSAYVENLQKLLARVRSAAPACDCLVLAPTDRADTEDRTPLVRDALREAARASSCMFWDTYEVMGGRGSIVAWRAESPPRAGPDGVHLHPRGYKDLGDKLAKAVLAGYQP
jgi:lysophospholipase L1-like esterase